MNDSAVNMLWKLEDLIFDLGLGRFDSAVYTDKLYSEKWGKKNG